MSLVACTSDPCEGLIGNNYYHCVQCNSTNSSVYAEILDKSAQRELFEKFPEEGKKAYQILRRDSTAGANNLINADVLLISTNCGQNKAYYLFEYLTVSMIDSYYNGASVDIRHREWASVDYVNGDIQSNLFY